MIRIAEWQQLTDTLLIRMLVKYVVVVRQKLLQLHKIMLDKLNKMGLYFLHKLIGNERDRSQIAQQRGNGPPTESPAGVR